MTTVNTLCAVMNRFEQASFVGSVKGVKGEIIECAGLKGFAKIDDSCYIEISDNQYYEGEIISLYEDRSLLLLYSGKSSGVKVGAKVLLKGIRQPLIQDSWVGRVLNGLGEPIDNKGTIADFMYNAPSLNTTKELKIRRKIGARLETGLNVFNTFLPICKGQRVGIFSGSGVGKSTLLVKLALRMESDLVVIGLIGERSKEVADFIERMMQGNKKKVIMITATAEESPLMKRKAAELTMQVAEFFKQKGLHVLCLMDSITRIAEAQREIGLAGGEPPALRAFPPSVFREIARICERSGPGLMQSNEGDITGIFTVLVQGSDMEEPISDAVRGILDGHVILDRKIAERGRFPAVDVVRSVSRSLMNAIKPNENNLLMEAKIYLSEYVDNETIIRIGAYKKGSDVKIDKAIYLHDKLERFFSDTQSYYPLVKDSFSELEKILKS